LKNSNLLTTAIVATLEYWFVFLTQLQKEFLF